jgi:serine protease AprX
MGADILLFTIGRTRPRDAASGHRRFAIATATAALAASVAFGSAQAATGSAPDYSMAAVTSGLGAGDWWNAGYTGTGVDVAVIDSGVSPVPGLNGGGKLVYGPDLSLESQAPNLRNFDTYGHGTFMAGLIAGDDGTATGYRGVAPGARIVSLKVATADGGTDVSQVVAAIDWVVQHRRDNGLNIRIINLSYGTASSQSAGLDPLSYAVEQAWKKGIVVVAAAGNAGYIKGAGSPCLADPAYNPYVIAVGGADTMGTASLRDDQVGTYSSAGAAGCKSPDFVAPGSHLQGLRDPNGWIDAAYPEARWGTRFFRGSGTSEATAIASGAVALVLQKYPLLTPDQIKLYFRNGAVSVPSTIGFQQGAGEISLAQMLSRNPSASTQSFAAATGRGTLEGARGPDHLSRNGVALTGERDIFGAAVSTASLATAEAAGNTWSGGTWNGNTWSGNTWSGNTWTGNTWSGNTWSGNTWSGNTWSGNTWSGNTWSGNTWSGSSWSGNTWSGNTWAGGSWS